MMGDVFDDHQGQSKRAEDRLKTLEKAVKDLIDKYAKLDKDFTEHVVIPDAHNAGMLARRKK